MAKPTCVSGRLPKLPLVCSFSAAAFDPGASAFFGDSSALLRGVPTWQLNRAGSGVKLQWDADAQQVTVCTALQ